LAPIEKSLDADLKMAQSTALRLNECPGAVLAAAVLYAKPNPANPRRGDAKKLALALKIGDLLAGGYERGEFQKLLNHNWGTYMWVDAFRLLEKDLGAERADRWGKALKKDVQEVFNDVAACIDFPRYQVPYLFTSTN